MKTFLLLLLFSFISADELKWVDEQIEAIKPPRQGIKAKDIASIKDPFIVLIKSSKKKNFTSKRKRKKYSKATKKNNIEKKFSLSMTMNKSAMINKKWYKLGDIISGYKIVEISSSSIVLTKKKKKIFLSTHSENRNLNFKN